MHTNKFHHCNSNIIESQPTLHVYHTKVMVLLYCKKNYRPISLRMLRTTPMELPIGRLEAKVNSTYQPSLVSLKDSIVKKFALPVQHAVFRVCKVYRTRLEKVMAANDG